VNDRVLFAAIGPDSELFALIGPHDDNYVGPRSGRERCLVVSERDWLTDAGDVPPVEVQR
jgi:hypothetical protein